MAFDPRIGESADEDINPAALDHPDRLNKVILIPSRMQLPLGIASIEEPTVYIEPRLISVDMDDRGLKTIALYARHYPLFVFLLAPELIYSMLFSFWYLVESINHSMLGREMEAHVGLGIIFMVFVYGMLFITVLAVFALLVWRLIRSVRISRGLLRLSEPDRRSLVVANFLYTVFIIAALLFANFCDLPGRSDAPSYSTEHVCEESAGRKLTKALDILILPYFASSLFVFSRRRTRLLFSRQ